MRLRSLLSFILCVSCFVVPSTNSRAENWPQFRGTHSDGVAQAGFPGSWDTNRNVRWKIAIDGEGWSCPIVWEHDLLITRAVRTDTGTNEQSGQRPGRGDLTSATYRWDVMCIDTQTGEIRWEKTARTGNPPLNRHTSNTYATETIVTDGQRVYAYFGMNGLYCYNLSGELQWQKDLGTYEMRAGWGTASSPALHDGIVYLQIDNEEKSFVVALDGLSGDEIWRTHRDERSQYGSPIIWKNSLRTELVTGGQQSRSYDLKSGDLLWSLDMQKGRCSSTPLVVGDMLYVGTELRNNGGEDDGGGYLFAVKAGGSGDISTAGQVPSPFVAWQLEKSGIQMASPVLCEGHLYLFERRSGMLHCVNAATGEMAYEQRVPGARAFWSSPWTVDGKVYALDDSGTTHVIAGGPEFEVLSRNPLDELTWSTPAIANGALFIRTAGHLYCIAEDGN